MDIREIGIVEFTQEELMGGVDKHHIVFRSQGGVDHYYNMIELPHGFHIGDRGPHKNRDTDVRMKYMQQLKLFQAFGHNELHTMDEILDILQPKDKKSSVHIEKCLRWKIAGFIEEKGKDVPVYRSNEIVRVLMGGKLYEAQP